MTIYLIGTNHGDLKGRKRLEATLERMKPELLFVEGCEEWYQRGQDVKVRLAQKVWSMLTTKGYTPALIEHLQKILLPRDEFYEMNVCVEYAERNGFHVLFVDSPEHVSASLKALEEKVDIVLAGLPSAQEVDITSFPTEEELNEEAEQLYDVVNGYFTGTPDLQDCECALNPFRGVLIGQRDIKFEEKIREIYTGQTAAVVIGLLHLLDDPRRETLYERIKDLQPVRMTIKQ